MNLRGLDEGHLCTLRNVVLYFNACWIDYKIHGGTHGQKLYSSYVFVARQNLLSKVKAFRNQRDLAVVFSLATDHQGRLQWTGNLV